MTRVLFVCLGNICRSPMAEGVLRHLVAERGASDRFEIDSAGTAAYHEGEPPDRRTTAELRRHGIESGGLARRVRDGDFAHHDFVFAMDRSNERELLRRCPDEHAHKVSRVLESVGGGDVGDPYYGGPDGFARNYEQLRDALGRWLDEQLA